MPLDSCRMLARVGPEGRARLRDMAVIRRYPRGRRIFRQGDECPGLFIVGSGLVRVFKATTSGKEHVLHLVAPGNTFAEVAVIGGFACPADVEALEDSICLLLPTGPFMQALRDDHQLSMQILQGLAVWVRHLVGLIEDIALRDATGRVARYLLDAAAEDDPQIDLPGAKKHLASHLNLTSETLSRSLRRLGEAGLIDTKSGARMSILDRDGLRAVAGKGFPKL